MRSLWQTLQVAWAKLDRFQRGLLGLVLLRLLIALIFMLDVLPLDLRYGWYLHHGGDQELMMQLGTSILEGHPTRSLIGIGQPLVMLVWIALLHPFYYTDIVVPLVLINGFVLAGLSVVLLEGIVRHTIEDERVALSAAATWALAPLITYFAFFWHFDPVILRSANVPKIGWLNGLSDGPAAFFSMLAIYLLAWLRKRERPAPHWDWLGLGAVLSVMVMFRIHLAPLAAFLLIYVWIVYGWRVLLVVCGAGLLTYLPQAWYNQRVFAMPFTTGYISMNDMGAWGGTFHRPLSDIIGSLPFHPNHWMELGGEQIGRRPWLLIPLGLLLLVGITTVILLWRRRGWQAAALLIGAPLAYLGPMSLAWPFRDDIIRFSIPATPALIALLVYAVWTLWDWALSAVKRRANVKS